MPDQTLAAPVARLLELGEPKIARDFEWPDYFSYGIGPEHVPALIRISVDQGLINAPDENNPSCWGPVHAWRALGQLRAVEAIEPLINLFHEVKDNDWVIEEMPDVFSLIGPPAFKSLAVYLRDMSRPTYSRLVAATSLMEIGQAFPELRSAAVNVIAEQLEKYASNSPGANGVLIANLVELGAVEKTDLIRRVFVEGKVDRFIVGDWRDVQVRLQCPGCTPVSAIPSSLRLNIKKIPPDPIGKPAEQITR